MTGNSLTKQRARSLVATALCLVLGTFGLRAGAIDQSGERAQGKAIAFDESQGNCLAYHAIEEEYSGSLSDAGAVACTYLRCFGTSSRYHHAAVRSARDTYGRRRAPSCTHRVARPDKKVPDCVICSGRERLVPSASAFPPASASALPAASRSAGPPVSLPPLSHRPGRPLPS